MDYIPSVERNEETAIEVEDNKWVCKVCKSKWDQDVLQCGACGKTSKPGMPTVAPAGLVKQPMETSSVIDDKVQVYKNAALVLYIIAYVLFILALVLPMYRVRPHRPDEVCPPLQDKEYMAWNQLVHLMAAMNGEIKQSTLMGLAYCNEAQPEYTQTIPQSIQTMFDEGSYFPGILIIVFTLTIPILKGLLCFFDLLRGENKGLLQVNTLAFKCVVVLSKFAMMDVYVIALIVAFTSFKDSKMPLDFTPEAAFYISVGYSVVALLAVTLHGKVRGEW